MLFEHDFIDFFFLSVFDKHFDTGSLREFMV